MEAAALGGIRPIVCRQERVGVGIAHGLSRVSNGDHMGVFAMQYGPGAENAYPGIATAYSDSTPVLLLPPPPLVLVLSGNQVAVLHRIFGLLYEGAHSTAHRQQ